MYGYNPDPYGAAPYAQPYPPQAYPPPAQYPAPAYPPVAPAYPPAPAYPVAPAYPDPNAAFATYPPPSASFQPPQGGGNKKALLVGINYLNNPQARLNGCINDATFLKFLLTSKFGISEQNILILTDDSADMTRRPTKANLINAMRWLVGGARPGDSLFFSFSGHGGQVRDVDGDEADGFDETILPEDYKIAGPIVDDDLHLILANAVPYGAKLTCIMDCCHSGTGLDLPYVYTSGRLICEPMAQRKTTVGEVVLFSSCRDNQTAADSKSLSRVAFSGVLTFTFCKSIETHHPYLTYASLIQAMQKFSAEKGFSQVIQLSSGKPIDLNLSFNI